MMRLMVRFYVTLIGVLAVCSGGEGDIPPDIKHVMAYGTMSELNTFNRGNQADLLVRLFGLPTEDQSCFVETHGVCRNRYYVTVAPFGEEPEGNVFRLSYEGEVTGVAWQAEDRPDYAEIELALNQYTDAAFGSSSVLSRGDYRTAIMRERVTMLLHYPVPEPFI